MARKRPSSNEQVPIAGEVSRLAGFGARSDKQSRADWGEADCVLVAGLVVSVTRRGGLASFGYTRDGGAATITVFLDGERSTEYIKPDDDMDAKLGEAVDYFHNLPD